MRHRRSAELELAMGSKTVTLAALFLALVGCGPQRGEFACEGTSWTFDRQPQCSTVEHNLALAEKLLGHPVPNVDVVVLDVKLTESGAHGNYDVRWGVTLGCDGLSFLHELLHLDEAQAGKLGTVWHEGWDTNGNQALADEYVQSAWPFRCSNPQQ